MKLFVLGNKSSNIVCHVFLFGSLIAVHIPEKLTNIYLFFYYAQDKLQYKHRYTKLFLLQILGICLDKIPG